MIRTLILSDSHGDSASCRMALEAEPKVEWVIHLGDGEEDLDTVPEALLGGKIRMGVRGNGYGYYGNLPYDFTCNIGGFRIFCSHGHREKVKYGTELLVCTAKEKGASAALFGHTHIPYYALTCGIYLFNPGSIRDGDYGIMEIADGEIKFLKKCL